MITKKLNKQMTELKSANQENLYKSYVETIKLFKAEVMKWKINQISEEQKYKLANMMDALVIKYRYSLKKIE